MCSYLNWGIALAVLHPSFASPPLCILCFGIASFKKKKKNKKTNDFMAKGVLFTFCLYSVGQSCCVGVLFEFVKSAFMCNPADRPLLKISRAPFVLPLAVDQSCGGGGGGGN